MRRPGRPSARWAISLIDTTTGMGTMATLCLDRVTRLASGARVDRATVLGRAMAHEVAHLILGRNEHSETGLMCEIWTEQQLASGKPAGLAVSSEPE